MAHTHTKELNILMKNHVYCLLLCLTSVNVFANMASPIFEGTKSANVITSNKVEVLNESIFIRSDKQFLTADFKVVYRIRSEHSGSLPLVFVALDYLGDFTVKLDGKVLTFVRLTDTSNLLKKLNVNDTLMDKEGQVHVRMFQSHEEVFSLRDLLYFEPYIGIGEHEIEVNYQAKHWENMGGEIVQSEFRYSLTPAKYWKSFGHLSVVYDNSEFNQPVIWNLDGQKTSMQQKVLKSEFNQLPAEFIVVTYVPVLKFGEYISVSTANKLSLLIFVALFGFLIFLSRKMMKKGRHWRLLLLLLGFLSLPVLVLFIREGFLDFGLGSDHHIVSYLRDYGTFMVFPFLYLVYLVLLIVLLGVMYPLIKKPHK